MSKHLKEKTVREEWDGKETQKECKDIEQERRTLEGPSVRIGGTREESKEAHE